MPSHDVDRPTLRAAIAAELRAALARADISQGALGERVNMHRVTINRLLNGERPLEVEVLYAFADALDFDAGELVDAAKRNYLQQIARRDVKSD
ncbi:helix-turn-helix domain-containing protein [Nocardia sp. IFM 10818]